MNKSVSLLFHLEKWKASDTAFSDTAFSIEEENGT